MAELIKADNTSSAWVLAMEHLVEQCGSDANLIVAIERGDAEISAIRRKLDTFLAERESPRVRRIRKVADTIFPIDFYHGPPGETTRQRLYRNQRRAARIERRFIQRGTYFDRLIDWPGADTSKDEDAGNQLERRLRLLKRLWDSGKKTWNAGELAVSSAMIDESLDIDEVRHRSESGDLRIQDPLSDNFSMGFPCLSHISLTLRSGRLDLTAVYRNHHYITKAYGNFIGLSDLQRFLCSEIGCTQGELVCVSTHADAEFGDNGISKRDILNLVNECRRILDGM